MANITEELEKINTAFLYSKDVRNALYNGLKSINTQVEDLSLQKNVVQEIKTLIDNSKGIIQEASKIIVQLQALGEAVATNTLQTNQNKIDITAFNNNIMKYKSLVHNDDWTSAIKTALKNDNVVYLPKGTYNISDTIQLVSNQKLYGDGLDTIINYTGAYQDKKALFLLGSNEVGAVPINMEQNIILKGLYINGNKNIGFGVYSAFIQNHCEISNIRVTNTIQHAMYITKSWYCKFFDLTANKNLGCGLSFGVPLAFNDGTIADWSSCWDALHLNNNFIQNIRSELAGFDKKYNQETNLKWGYGLGLGRGEGFNVTNFLAETSYGVGVYIYRACDVVFNLKNGYIERNALGRNDGKGTDIIPILFDIDDVNAKYIKLEDVYINQDDLCVNIILTGKQVPTSGSITLDNVACGGGIKILNNGPKDIFHIKNCWWRMSYGGFNDRGYLTYKNGYPINVCEGTLEIQPNNVSTILNLPTGFNQSIRRVYVYAEKETISVSNFDKNNTAQITVFYKNADPQWCRLPKVMKPYELYPLCDIGMFPTYMHLANDNAIGTKLNFVVFTYTGDKPTYI